MQENDKPTFSGADILAAIGLLSRLRVPVDGDFAMQRGARAAWAYPIAGAIIGVIGALVGWVSLGLGFGPSLTAAIVLMALAFATGAMHEDGLADCADGFWGGDTTARRLEIMADSRVGAYGVLALVLVTLARWSALGTIFATGSVFAPLVAAAVLSRVPMVVMMQSMTQARDGGLADRVGRPGTRAVWVAVAIGGLFGLGLLGFGVFSAIVALIIAAGLLSQIAIARIGGQTGDVLGASQQLCEVAVLAAVITTL